MGRRSLHTADELRELIIGASTELIQDAGLGGLSAREIARRINYSPGTLYNSFENLDDLILTIEGRLLDGLIETLSALPQEGTPREQVHRVANAYLSFAAHNPKLWSLISEHRVPASQGVPASYRQKLETLVGAVEDVLRPLAREREDEDIRRAALALWAGMHAIASLSAADKLSIIAAGDAGALMDDFVGTYLDGFEAALR